MSKVGRNHPCPCGGGKKYKHCHGALTAEPVPPSPRSRMERRQIYPDVGTCIYCGATGPDLKPSDEHVIAQSLGGTLLLPKSSCDRCGGLTSEPELHCSRKLYAVIRRQLRFPSKRGNKTRPMTFKATLDGVEHDIHANDYPGLLFSFAPAMPGILIGAEPKEGFSGGVAIHTLPDFGERLNKLRAKYRAKVLDKADQLMEAGNVGATNRLEALTVIPDPAEGGGAQRQGPNLGKKAAAAAAAGAAATGGGAFAPPPPPKLVVNNDGKS